MGRLTKVSLAASLGAGLFVSFVAPASATLIVGAGNLGGGDNVISNAGCGPTGAPSTTIMGCLTSNNSTDVIFQSTANSVQESLDFAAGGQAKVVAAGVANPITEPSQTSQTWGYNNVTISLGGGLVFSQIGLNLGLFETSDIKFTDDLGETFTFLNFDPTGNGDINIHSDAGDLTWLRIESSNYTAAWKVQGHNHSVTDGDINDIKQVRFEGIKNPPCTGPNCSGPGPSVPEPATIFLFGSALLGYGASRRRKPA